MSKLPLRYTRRSWLRTLEKGTAVFENTINRFSTAGERIRPYNPFYHLGTLAVFLLIVLTTTGVYLTLVYRPGVAVAYPSIVRISTSWFGSLMRTVHRYASDALIIVAMLHALKMLFSDRFWGSRWLAWTSGWIMMGLFWILGLMGYWLVWDQGAQWLTQYTIDLFNGPFAYTFFGEDIASATFSLFVIVLFLHVFLPVLLIVGVIVHGLRLTRTRYWSPRWLMITATLVLIVLAVFRPAALTIPADFSRIVERVPVDWWYMGFLPLVQKVGSGWFWIVAILLFLAAVTAPWLRPGQHDGPAVVLPNNCTGCSACVRECPYEAIEMVLRDDETPYNSLAVVTPNLCTGCGVCVGSCPDQAIELDALHSVVMREDLRRTLGRSQAAGDTAVTIFACERHAVLSTLPPLADPQPIASAHLEIGGVIPLLQAKLPPRVNVGSWQDSQGKLRPVVTCVVPCTGMLHPNWAAETIEAGGAGAIVVSCPADDCSYREGPHWIANRLQRRRTLRKGNVHFLELAPGNQKTVTSLWAKMIGDEEAADAARHAATVVGHSEGNESKTSLFSQFRYAMAGFVLLLVTFVFSILLYTPVEVIRPLDSQIRFAINHGGHIKAASGNLSDDVIAKLPDNVDPIQVLGGTRSPVALRMFVDGEMVFTETYKPRGLRHEGSIYAVENWWVTAGRHQVKIELMDDETNWRTAFNSEIITTETHVVTLLFDEEQGVFVERD